MVLGGEGFEDGGNFFLGGLLVGIEWGHVTKRELVDDVLGEDDGRGILWGKGEVMERAFAFLFFLVMAFDAVIFQEGFRGSSGDGHEDEEEEGAHSC